MMAPIHHHFEKKGGQIHSCYQILDYFINLAMIGLATLKLR